MIQSEDTLRYAACLLACAVAGADGRMQEEEKHQLQTIINQELVLNSKSFRYAGVLGNLIRHSETLRPDHKWALSELKKNEKQVSPEFKDQVVRTIRRVAEVFAPVTPEESALVQQIQQELQAMNTPPQV
jgi:hypothetical protein